MVVNLNTLSELIIPFYNNGKCILCNREYQLDVDGYYCDHDDDDNKGHHYVALDNYFVICNYQIFPNRGIHIFIDFNRNTTDIYVLSTHSDSDDNEEKISLQRALNIREVISYLNHFKKGLVWW